MMGWHFHWVFAPILLLVGILIGVVVAPTGSTAAPAPTAPVSESAVERVSDTAPYETNPDGPIGEMENLPEAEPQPVEVSSHQAQLDAFQRQNYEHCVAQNLIGDRCRQIFYPEGPAEEAQAAQWRREAAPAVEANIRFLSEYNERQIRENSGYQ